MQRESACATRSALGTVLISCIMLWLGVNRGQIYMSSHGGAQGKVHKLWDVCICTKHRHASADCGSGKKAHRVGQGSGQALLQAAESGSSYCGRIEGHLCGQIQELGSQGIQVGNGQRRLPSQLRKVLH